MDRYAPLTPPDLAQRLALSEDERLRLVNACHSGPRPPIPRLDLHCGLQAFVEDQAALGDETPVLRTPARLLKKGADLHAIMSTLFTRVQHAFASRGAGARSDVACFQDLYKVTMRSHHRDFG